MSRDALAAKLERMRLALELFRPRLAPGDVLRLIYVGDDGSEEVALEITVPGDSAA
jgi:hypothetical protein